MTQQTNKSMKKFIHVLLTFALLAFMSIDAWAAAGVCGTCGASDWDDDDFLCGECYNCADCQTNEFLHCFEGCGECHESVGEICWGCGMCHNCQNDNFYHCLYCGECYGGDPCFECCGLCNTCAYEMNAHCMECGGCANEDENVCETCGMCVTCAMEQGAHCEGCRGCFTTDHCCTICYLCEDCQLAFDTHCASCRECNFGEVCENCDLCEECALEAFIHCAGCYECVSDDICQNCGMCSDCSMSEMSHCMGCGKCIEDIDVCQDCGYCADCAVNEGMHCWKCSDEHIDCEDCYLCFSCISDVHAHCEECDGCFYEDGGLCDDCGLCGDCAESNGYHCQECGECFYSEGGICDKCQLCNQCAIDEGYHCSNCEENHVTCTNGCGLCDECALEEGVHCSVCEECDPDNVCEEGGNHCKNCCEEEGWLCEQCSRCTKGMNIALCDDCGFCIECCNSNSTDSNCKHNICVKGSEWNNHYCTTCKKCKPDCEHGKTYVAHTHNYVDGVCTICKASESGKATIFRQPCSVVVDNNTTEATFSVLALGNNLTYQWYKETNGAAKAISGSDDNELTINTTNAKCNGSVKYYCKISNETTVNGKLETFSVTTNKVEAITEHSFDWRTYKWLPKSEQSQYTKTVKIQKMEKTSTSDTTVTYSDFHFEVCTADGCAAFSGKKGYHTYTDWKVKVEPTETTKGSRYRRCTVCGEDSWEEFSLGQNATIDNSIVITTQPSNAKCKVPTSNDGKEQTVSFSIQAKGDNLTYQWYLAYNEVGVSDKVTEETLVDVDDDKNFIKGATTNKVVLSVPRLACYLYQYKVYCVVSNGKDEVKSEKAELYADHNMVVYTIDKIGTFDSKMQEACKLTQTYYDGSNKPQTVTYSNYHFLRCASRHGEVKKQAHSYGEWVIETKPTATTYGVRSKACRSCGEKFYETLPKTELGYPIVLKQPTDAKSKVNNAFCGDETKYKGTFTVEAIDPNGGILKYQWYEGTKGGSSHKIDEELEGYSGSKTAQLTVPASTSCDSRFEYYCEITSSKGKVNTNYVKVNTSHNLSWVSLVNEMMVIYREGTKYEDSKTGLGTYVLSKSIKGNINNTNNTVVTKEYSKYHFRGCPGEGCGKIDKTKELHTYGGWMVMRKPTSTLYGILMRKCIYCDEPIYKNIDPVADSKNPYSDMECDMLNITSASKTEDAGNGSTISGTVVSGQFNEGDNIWIVKEDGTKLLRTIVNMEVAGKSATSCTKGDKVTFDLMYEGDGEYYIRYDESNMGWASNPVYAISSPSKLQYNDRSIGIAYFDAAIGHPFTTYYFKIGEKRIPGRILSHADVETSETAKYTYKDVTFYLDGVDKLFYNGMSIQVYEGKNDTYPLGYIVVNGKVASVPDNYVVDADGNKIYFNEASDKITSGVSYSPATNRIYLENANLKAIYIGDKDFGGQPIAISVKGENTISTKEQGQPAIYCAGQLTLKSTDSNAGHKLNVSSLYGNGIETPYLDITDNNQWKLDVSGNEYGIKTEYLNNKVSTNYTGIEMHVKCNKTGGKMALSNTNIADEDMGVYFTCDNGVAILDNNYDATYDDWVWSVYDYSVNKPSKEFYSWLDPAIIIGGNAIWPGVTDLAKSSDFNSATGTISYDPETRTLTLDNVNLEIDGESAITIGRNSSIGDITIKVVGDNHITVTGEVPERWKKSNKGALQSYKNFSIVGGPQDKLHIAATDGMSGVYLFDDVTLDIKDKVHLSVAGDYSFDGVNKEGTELIIGEDVYADLYGDFNGIYDLKLKVSSDEITERADRILYPFAIAFSYDLGQQVINYIDENGLGDDYEHNKHIVIGKHDGVCVNGFLLSEFTDGLELPLGPGSSGYFIYDRSSKTLNLYADSNERISSRKGQLYDNVISIYESDLTIVNDHDDIIFDDYTDIYAYDSNVKLTGSKKYTFATPSKKAVESLFCVGSSENSTTIEFKDANVEFADNAWLASDDYGHDYKTNTCSVVVSNSTLKFGENSSIGGVSLKLKKQKFDKAGYKFDNDKTLLPGEGQKVVDTNTATEVKGNFSIVPNVIVDNGYVPTDPDEIKINDEPTSVENISSEGLDESQPMYNLLGQRVMSDYKGVVVQNGKRYLKK